MGDLLKQETWYAVLKIECVISIKGYFLIPRHGKAAHDNVFGLSIMIFTASLKIMSLPKDINRLHFTASSPSNFAR